MSLDAISELEVGSDGGFEFPYLPEGDWVLRLVSGWSNILVQRQLHTDRNLAIDLGRLQPPKTVEVEVEIELPEVEPEPEGQYFRKSFGIWIREPVEGHEQGIFLRTVQVVEGIVKLGALEPGAYEIDLFSGFSFMSSGISGDSTGAIRSLTVRPDGTVDPGKLSFR